MARILCLVRAPLAALLLVWSGASHAEEPRRHALSLIGEPRFGPEFKHFDWVNPAAPKGGRVRQWAMGSFDSLNPFTVKGSTASAVSIIYDQLMVSSPDEPSTEYGQIAEWVSHPDDFSSATFQLRPIARFHDGKPITADDVVFSLDAIKKASPFFSAYYKNVIRAEKLGEHQVKFHFDVKGNRELPLIIGQLVVLPKHFWEAKSATGEPRDLSKSTLEVPLGSGPYRIKHVDAGRSIVYERVADYWAKDLPVAKGQWNLDEIKYIYFQSQDAAFLAFQAGELDFWRESSAKYWATRYEFDAVRRGHIIKLTPPDNNVAPMQAFAFNTRRPQFQDPRVRQAFNLAFNFEWMNQNLFYGQYSRVSSYFENTELAERGLPQGKELEILETVRDQVPPEVFTAEYKNPINDATSIIDRRNWREAAKLLNEAGWEVKNGALVNAKGEQMTADFLLVQPDFVRIVAPFQQALERLGVKVSVRVIDAAQYQSRTDEFDFDIITDSFPQSESPGNEQRDFWGSDAAGRSGSRNSIGIKNPAVDKLIDRIIFATDRDDLIAACRALDRVLLWNHYVIPQFFSTNQRIAYWNKYSAPETLPSRTIGFPMVWWYDEAKAAKLAGN